MVSQFCGTALALSAALSLYALNVASSTTLVGPNVCSNRVSSTISQLFAWQQRYTVRSSTSCWDLWSWFSCTVTRVKYRTVYTTTYYKLYSTRRFCCSGYSQVGRKCQPVCSPTCKNGGTCVRPGQCQCASGWTGFSCTIPECHPGCTTNSGTCVAPFNCLCPAGMSGPDCLTACSGSRFGRNCAEICTCKNGASCDPVLGNCSCTAGWRGTNCDQPCPNGTYGIGCGQCSCENGAACDRVSGKCICSPGYYGTSCEHRCSSWTFGHNCGYSCVCHRVNSFNCSHVDGQCNCHYGWKGLSCSESCPNGFYGLTCQLNCTCPNGTCDRYTGQCRGEETGKEQTRIASWIWGAVGGRVCLLLVALVVVLVYRKKRNHSKVDVTLENDHVTFRTNGGGQVTIQSPHISTRGNRSDKEYVSLDKLEVCAKTRVKTPPKERSRMSASRNVNNRRYPLPFLVAESDHPQKGVSFDPHHGMKKTLAKVPNVGNRPHRKAMNSVSHKSEEFGSHGPV